MESTPVLMFDRDISQALPHSMLHNMGLPLLLNPPTVFLRPISSVNTTKKKYTNKNS